MLFWGRLLNRGRLAEALATLKMDRWPPRGPACDLEMVSAWGIPVPHQILEAHLRLEPSDDPSEWAAYCKGVYALDRGRLDEHARILEAHRKTMLRARAEGDSATARNYTWSVGTLEAYERWKAGDPAGALPILQHLIREYRFDWHEDHLKFWIGRIYLELGRPDRALPYLATRRLPPLPIAHDPLADYHAAVAYERAGRFEEARLRYSSLVEHWRDPDPELRPLVERSRRAVERVSRK